MDPAFNTFNAKPLVSSAGRLLAIASTWLCAIGSLAKISEPPMVIYGSIYIRDQLVTADRSDVVLRTSSLLSGKPLITYRMGSDPSVGDRFVLRLPMEAVDPIINPLAVPAGDLVLIELFDLSGKIGDTVATVEERGQVLQVNFLIESSGIDLNGLPDDWELDRFGRVGVDPDADADQDGLTNREEFESGSDPNDPTDHLFLDVALAVGFPEISFLARRAAGPGYDRYRRVYRLETTTNVGIEPWSPVSGATDILGNDQVVAHNPRDGDDTQMFRLIVTLERP